VTAPRLLISSEYLALQRDVHGRPEGYGGKGKRWAETVVALVRHFGASSVLDYGSGRGSLTDRLRLDDLLPRAVRVDEYDPAVPGKDRLPYPADLVTTTDVLEHVEPDRLDAVLAHIRLLSRYATLFVVATGPANKVLADGRNAHLIQEPAAWWQARVEASGYAVLAWEDAWPIPSKVSADEARRKHWIAVGVPC
jgi:hypothetical protein